MDNSKLLLTKAIKSLKEANIEDDLWAVGGGTVLSSVYGHRLSKDIDVFVSDPQLLSRISPRFNSVTENALDYEETNSFISLTFPEGKIDFINASQVSGFMPVKRSFLDNNVFVEDVVEIVSKKMFFRGKYALPRDLFDLAVVYNSERKNDLLNTFNFMKNEVAVFEKAFLRSIGDHDFVPYTLSNRDMLLASNKIMDGKEIDYCKKLLADLQLTRQDKVSKPCYSIQKARLEASRKRREKAEKGMGIHM